MPDEALEFDIIVVGAGSAGCVVAGRLSEITGLKIALVDAGTKDHLRLTKIPAAVLKTLGHPRYDYRFKTEPDPTRNGRVDQIARGKVLGGSSAINGLIFARGAPVDFDRWSALGNHGWDWQSVLPLFRRLETSELADNSLRGGLGPQDVTLPGYRHTLTDPFIAAAVRQGIPFNPDYNGETQEGIGYVQGTIRRGVRVSAYDGYIAPNRNRPNLQIFPGCRAEKLTFEGSRAAGLVARRGDELLRFKARSGVVVSLGTFNSPQLLMLSGIGPADRLQQLGIAVRGDLARVGQDMLDHTGFRMIMEVDMLTANNQSRGLRAPYHLAQWLMGGRGPVGAASAEAVGFFRSTPGAPSPDLQVTFFPYASEFNAAGRAFLKPKSLISVGVNMNYPKSRSHVTIRSADPADPVEIHYRLFDHADDLETLVRGLRITRRLVEGEPFGGHIVDRSLYPSTEAGDEADRNFVRLNSRSYMHPISTCRMGADAGSVVTPGLKVRGFEGLWVADASVFPDHVSGNINATALMIGEKAADLIKAEVRQPA
jgi:choline dehydrogenase